MTYLKPLCVVSLVTRDWSQVALFSVTSPPAAATDCNECYSLAMCRSLVAWQCTSSSQWIAFSEQRKHSYLNL